MTIPISPNEQKQDRTGATEQRVSNEQVHTAIMGLLDAWNDPNNHNPRTRRRYKEPWSSRLWFQFMRAGLEALVPDGYVIARAADVLTTEQRARMKYLASYLDGYKAPEQVGCAAWDIADTIRAIAEGGTE